MRERKEKKVEKKETTKRNVHRPSVLSLFLRFFSTQSLGKVNAEHFFL